MSAALTTQMLTPSLRRVYRSRAACTALSASGACSEPTCTWLSPRLLRTNTSYSGQSRRTCPGAGATGTSGPVGTAPCPPSAVTSALMRPPVLLRAHRLDSGLVPLLGRRRSSRCSLARRLRGVGRGRLGHPGVVVAGGPPPGDPLGVAGATSGQHPPELVPVDRAEAVAAGLRVQRQLGVGQVDAEELGLRHGHVHEPLAQFVVGVPLDAPRHRLRIVRA